MLLNCRLAEWRVHDDSAMMERGFFSFFSPSQGRDIIYGGFFLFKKKSKRDININENNARMSGHHCLLAPFERNNSPSSRVAARRCVLSNAGVGYTSALSILRTGEEEEVASHF